jgi:hypothetical protein
MRRTLSMVLSMYTFHWSSCYSRCISIRPSIRPHAWNNFRMAEQGSLNSMLGSLNKFGDPFQFLIESSSNKKCLTWEPMCIWEHILSLIHMQCTQYLSEWKMLWWNLLEENEAHILWQVHYFYFVLCLLR